MSDSIYAWSTTAASNATADASINWAEFQDPDTVNNSARAMMARIAAYLADVAPKRTSAGTGNAYTVTSDAAGVALVDGMTIVFFVDRTNTGPCTLNVDGLGAKPFRPKTATEFNPGDLIADQPLIAWYSSTSDEWLGFGTAYVVSGTAAGVSLQSILATMPKIGDVVISMSPTVAAGRIRLTESTQSILKTEWPELNSWLSDNSYPWGSTATHFNLPPAAGYFLRFAATTTAVDTSGARTAGSTQSDQNKAHTHTVSVTGTTNTTGAHTHTVTMKTSTANNGGAWNAWHRSTDIPGTSGSETTGSNGNHSHTVTASGTAASDGEDEARVKNVAFHADIVASTSESAAQIAVFGFPYRWDASDVVAGDPGAGYIRGNNATLADITELYINPVDGFGSSIAGLLDLMLADEILHIGRTSSGAIRIIAQLTDVPTDAGAYYVVPVTIVIDDGSFATNDHLFIHYTPRGVPGPAGPAVSDADYGDITVSSSGTVWTIDSGAVTTAKTASTIVATDRSATLVAGHALTDYNAGTKSSGTYLPDIANGNSQYAINGGAHTLSPPAVSCTMVIHYTNNGSAGTITTSGFTKVSGTPTTTDTHEFFAQIIVANGKSALTWFALQ